MNLLAYYQLLSFTTPSCSLTLTIITGVSMKYFKGEDNKQNLILPFSGRNKPLAPPYVFFHICSIHPWLLVTSLKLASSFWCPSVNHKVLLSHHHTYATEHRLTTTSKLHYILKYSRSQLHLLFFQSTTKVNLCFNQQVFSFYACITYVFLIYV